LLDLICQRYSQRPSSIIGIKNKLVAIDFDFAIAVKSLKTQQEEGEKIKTASIDKIEKEKLKLMLNRIK